MEDIKLSKKYTKCWAILLQVGKVFEIYFPLHKTKKEALKELKNVEIEFKPIIRKIDISLTQ